MMKLRISTVMHVRDFLTGTVFSTIWFSSRNVFFPGTISFPERFFAELFLL